MLKKHITLVALILPNVLLAQNINKMLSGTYVGLWADTRWTYEFAPDGNFTFLTRGHFGNTQTIGRYKVIADTVIISAFPREQQRDSSFLAFTDTLLLDGDSCIIHFSIGYDYCKLKENQEIIEHSRQRRKPRDEFKKPEQL